jgi:uncharacterized membrane protein
MAIGPVQLLVVGFDEPDFRGEVLAEITRLRESDTVRLIDLLVVHKQSDGSIERLQRSDLDAAGAQEFGETVGALIGFGAAGEEGIEAGMEAGAVAIAESGGHVIDPDEMWYVEDAIPPGSAAAIALIEHRWALGLRGSIRDAGGRLLTERWIHPADLVAVGLLGAEEARAGG